MLRLFAGVAALVSVVLVGCSGDSQSPIASGSGGNPNAGGSTAVGSGGKTVANGGAATGQGGAVGAGGQHQGQGGAFGQGGATSQGGVGVGGAVGQGGAVTTTGGQSAVGGNGIGGKASGGAASVGGSSTGGKSAGGASNAGGSATAGNAAGGAVNLGGAATGGTVTGGAATGGTATGGATAATGGSSGAGTTPIKVWIAGDSTVQTCSSSCPCGWGSPTAFGSYFNANVTINNQAISGRSIQTWMYEPNVTSTLSGSDCVVTETNSTRWSTVLSGLKSGDYFLIQFGINDGDSACPRHVSSARYVTLLKRLGQAALDKGARPIFITPTGMIKCSGSTAVASRGFITETKTAGADLGVPVIDLHALSTALYNTLAFCPLPAGNTDISATTGGAVGAFFCDDHTHFDAAGAQQIAGAVAKALKDQAIGLASYLK